MLVRAHVREGSPLLRSSWTTALKTIGFLAMVRYGLIVFGLLQWYLSHEMIGFLGGAALLAVGFWTHVIVAPWVGFGLELNPFGDSKPFKPVPSLFVPDHYVELSSQDFITATSDLSKETMEVMKSFTNERGHLNVVDALNLNLYELLVAKPKGSNTHR